jgi:hypothetical protein
MKWIKPNGNEIDVNDDDATTEYAESLGWKKKEAVKEPVKEPVKKAK